MQSSSEWARETFGDCDLGDRRRTERLVEYASRQARKPDESTHAVCEGSGALKEGTFRFLRNENVSPEAITEGGCLATVRRCAGLGDILVIEDSTVMKYWHEGTEELGNLGGTPDHPSRGFVVHSALAVGRESGDIVGLLDQQYWTRPEVRRGANARKKVPYEEKETFKWQRSSERIRESAESTSSFIWVCDREADVYEYFLHKLQHGERFVVRAAYNRVVSEEHRYLWEQLKSEPVSYTRSVHIKQRGPLKGNKSRTGRSARTAKVNVQVRTITHAPVNPRKKTPLTFNAVYVSEPQAPEGAEPLEWMLLTTESIADEKAIETVIRCYEKRWIIEDFHRTWKTGCKSQERRLKSPSNLRRLLAVLAFIAVRIMQLRTGFEAKSKKSCETVMPKSYWQCLHASVAPKKKMPSKPPTVLWAATAVAKLAGWIETKKGMPPGHLTLWKGWVELENRVEGWEAAMALMTGEAHD